MEQGGAVFWQLVAGKEGDQIRRDIRDSLQQQIGFDLGTLADHKGDNQAPFWGKGDPHPRITIRLTGDFRPCQVRVFRLDKAPQFVQLALSDGQLLPQMQHNEPTMLSCAIEPEADGILIHLDDPCRCADRVAFRQGANSQGKEGRIVLQIKIRCSICQGDTAPTRAAQRLALAPCRPILHQAALTKAHAIQRAGRIRTIQGFPVHMTLGVPDDLAPAEDTVFRYDG